MAAGVLVVGAGPVGLATALELTRFGIGVRIVDKAPQASPESRAVVVNPRTLELLEQSGATERLLARGMRLRGARIVADGRLRATFDASRVSHRYNFMLGLAQSETEAAMAATLAEHGVHVERGVEVVNVADGADEATAAVRTPTGEAVYQADWIAGADGAHSTVRKSLGLDFPGVPYPFQWSLADIELRGDVETDYAELRLDRGAPILVRVPIAPGIHRVISNGPGVHLRLPSHWHPGAIRWQSDFTVSARRVRTHGRGRIWLLGDAAHIHSPAGGRGMNLGIEDGVSFARCIAVGAPVEGWARRRRNRAAIVIRESDAMQRLATAQRFFGRRVVPMLVGRLLSVKPVHDFLAQRICGLA